MGAGASADYYENGYAYKRRYYDGAHGRPRSRYDRLEGRPSSRYSSRPESRYSRPRSRYQERDRFHKHDYERRSPSRATIVKTPIPGSRTPLPGNKKIFTAHELEEAGISVDKDKSVRFADESPIMQTPLPPQLAPGFQPQLAPGYQPQFGTGFQTFPPIASSMPGIIPSAGYPFMMGSHGSQPLSMSAPYGVSLPSVYGSYNQPYYSNYFGNSNSYAPYRSWDTFGAYSPRTLPSVKPSIESFSKFGVPASGPVKMFNGDPVSNGRALITKRPS